MANKYGPWQSRARIEWVYTVAGISQSSTTSRVTVEAYLRMESQWSQNYNGSFWWGGWWGEGSTGKNYNLGPGEVVHLRSWNANVNLNDSTQSINFHIRASSYFGDTADTLTVQVPARFARTPSGLSVTRNSDTSQRLNWTRNSTYSAVVVQRRDNGGAWKQVGRPGGNVATWTDTSTKANGKYEYRVAGVGGSGQSGWSNTATVYTSPAAPTGASAERDGTNIVVNVSGRPPYASSYNIRDGGTQVATGVQLPWTHSNPSPSATHAYTVQGFVSGVAGAWSSASNTVQLISQPLAPNSLAPNGGIVVSDLPVLLKWKHNPVDASPQTAAEVQYRVRGATAWTTRTATTAQQVSVTLAAAEYEWQARTKGAHASWSPWSAIATVTVNTRPGVALQGEPVWDRPTYTAVWAWSQDEGRPQSAWQAELLDVEGALLEARSGSGAGSRAVFTARLTDGGTYTVRVRAAMADIWSEWSLLEFVTEFVPPAPPEVEAAWSELSGAVEITVHAGEGGVVADRLTVERSLTGGEPWEIVVDNAEFDTTETLSDFAARSNGDTWYRVSLATSVTDAAATAEIMVSADSVAVWLSGGAGFATAVTLPYSPEVSVNAGRARVLRQYAGRSRPVAHVGEALSRVVDASGMLLTDEQSPDALADLVQDPEPLHMYRDPDGRRVTGMLSDVSMQRESHEHWSFSFQLTETEVA